MIVTTVQELHRYAGMASRLGEAFEALSRLAAEPFVSGRHPVKGEEIFVNAAAYETHPAEGAQMEAHRAYIDVMWMVDGEEEIGVAPVSQLKDVTMEYDPAEDALLARLVEPCTKVRMTPGTVCILFPEDGHAPGLMAGTVSRVQKYIAKVQMD